jgi:hypothetical protein
MGGGGSRTRAIFSCSRYSNRAFPEFVFIHVLRDGRDMLFSDNQNQPRSYYTDLFGRPGDVTPEASAAFWSTVNLQATAYGKQRPKYRRRTKRSAEWEVAVERPTYDLTIFKLHCSKLTLKIYTKGERVLRIEAVAHNTTELNAVAHWKSFLKWSPG